MGLHHHGDEPEVRTSWVPRFLCDGIPIVFQAAGYTLDELLPLSRSSVLQQRVLSLQTLAKIIRRAHQGEYHDIVSGSVIDQLYEAGAPLLFRYALDESIEPVVMAAVQAVHALLVVSRDQVRVVSCSDIIA